MNKKITNDLCPVQIKALKDTMEVLSGKWKLRIIGTLIINGSMRFMELQKDLEEITHKKLSSDLQELLMNQLISRTELQSNNQYVTYTLTRHGRSLEPLIYEMINWGKSYREQIFNGNS